MPSFGSLATSRNCSVLFSKKCNFDVVRKVFFIFSRTAYSCTNIHCCTVHQNASSRYLGEAMVFPFRKHTSHRIHLIQNESSFKYSTSGINVLWFPCMQSSQKCPDTSMLNLQRDSFENQLHFKCLKANQFIWRTIELSGQSPRVKKVCRKNSFLLPFNDHS